MAGLSADTKQKRSWSLLQLLLTALFMHVLVVVSDPTIVAPAAASSSSAKKVNVSKGNSTKAKTPKPPIDLNSIRVDTHSCSKKRIVLELGKGGLGNKLFSVVSGTMLALALGRPLEIDWPDEVKQLRGTFEEFFVSPIAPVGENFNLTKLYNAAEHKEVIFAHTRCNVDLTIGGKKKQGETNWIMRRSSLMQKLDKECDNIRLKVNFDLTYVFFHADQGDFAVKLKSHFPLSVHDVFKKGFLTPRPEYVYKADVFKASHGIGTPVKYAAMHSRGLFDGSGDYTKVALMCAKSLIDKKLVDKIFFASDQTRMVHLAKEYLPANALVIYDNKTTVMSIREMGALGLLDNIKEPPKDPSYAIRNESDVAFLEWLVLGGSTYCLTPTVSTFFMTSILRSDCFYLDGLKGAACTDGVTAPLPRTYEPALFQRYVGLERFFAVNSTCDAICEESAWKTVKVVKVPAATNSSIANRRRQLCESVEDVCPKIQAYYNKVW